MKIAIQGYLSCLSIPAVLILILYVILAAVPAFVSLVGVVAILTAEVMLLNILRLYVRPPEVRGNFKWIYLFSQKALPQAQKTIETRTSDSKTSPAQPEDLNTLVGFPSKPESRWMLYFGWLWVPFFLIENFVIVFLTLILWLFYYPAWFFLCQKAPPYSLVTDALIALLFFKFCQDSYPIYAGRIEAFFLGPSVSDNRLFKTNAIITIACATILAAGAFYALTWRLHLMWDSRVTIQDSNSSFEIYTAEFFALLIGTFAVLELRRHWTMVRARLKAKQNGASVNKTEWKNYADDIRVELQRFELCHITDLHLTRPKSPKLSSPSQGDDVRTISRQGPGLWTKFRSLLEKNSVQLKTADAILITGDLTDSARASEWKGFFDAFEQMEHLFAKTVILPGNHDVNHCGIFTRDTGGHRSANRIRFLAAVDKIQGDRTFIYADGNFVKFRDWARQFTEDFRQYLENPPKRKYESTTFTVGDQLVTTYRDVTPPEVVRLLQLPSKVWKIAFPMVVTIGPNMPRFLIFDSNLPGSNIATNAFGEVNKRQIVIGKAVLADKHEPWIVGLHHHIGNPVSSMVRRPGGVILRTPGMEVLRGLARLFDRALTLSNVEQFLGIFPTGRGHVVFNGHRHMHYTGVIDEKVTVVSGASTTLGNCCDTSDEYATNLPSIARYSLNWDTDGNFSGLKRLGSLV
jgi:hypothetical protein